MWPDCQFQHDYETLVTCSSCGYGEEKISDNIVTEFDVANVEEEMNQAILNYANHCYMLGLQRTQHILTNEVVEKRMENLADEIRQASDNYKNNPNNDVARVYLNGLLMAQAILKGEID